MADEHKGWLDAAAADRLLRGEPAGPVGADADRVARAEAARLRAALDALTPPRSAGTTELPGEAAAVAAFRAAAAARNSVPAADRPAARRAAPVAVADEPLVDLAPIPPVRIPAQRRAGAPVRFGLAAALAGVAVGGIAAVAGTGLFDRDSHHTAGPAPAVSVSSDTDPAPAGDSAVPTLVPQLRPTPRFDGDHLPPSAAPGFSRAPGPEESRSTPGTTPATPWTPITSGAATVAPDGGHEPTPDRNSLTEDKSRDRDGQAAKPVDLCREYKTGNISGERRERLVKLAGTLAKVSRFCETAMDGGPRGNPPKGGSADQGSAVVSPPPQKPGGSLGFRSR
ncbi:hypothetical protein [Streptomyces sp. NPDC048606]|uniref:hypothetical protein n=1 Tax=Streptomyces sp. NPDC048606 TaxID=3154726 RepID=UPI00343A5339